MLGALLSGGLAGRWGHVLRREAGVVVGDQVDLARDIAGSHQPAELAHLARHGPADVDECQVLIIALQLVVAAFYDPEEVAGRECGGPPVDAIADGDCDVGAGEGEGLLRHACVAV